MARDRSTPIVLVLAVHPARVAATRLRMSQYSDHFADAGLELRLWSFFDDRGTQSWFGRRHRDRIWAALMGLLRMPAAILAIRRAGLVVVQREAIPFGPAFLELLAARLRPMVWDVDDSIWVPYVSPTAGRVPRWLRAPADKYGRIARSATEVWAGSEVLAAWCRQHNAGTVLVPTVVPVPSTRPVLSKERVAAWIGSHSTGGFVASVLPALGAIDPPVSVRVMGADIEVPDGDIELVTWSLDNERDLLARMRVGLYPIDEEHPLAAGKCGYKAILYMSHGIPCVVTPTETNAAIVRDGIEGIHARTPDEWQAAVQRIVDDPELCESMSERAYERAQTYSLEQWGPRLAERARAIVDGRASATIARPRASDRGVAALSALRCPLCRAPLAGESDVMTCTGGHRWPWRHGWLDLWPGTKDAHVERTIRSFGYEWTKFPRIRAEDERYWSWYFADVETEHLEDVDVLDAGCGKGRYTRPTALRARSVVALDASHAVDAAARNLGGLDHVVTVRGDLLDLPLADSHFGFVSCLGVLHHLREPRAGFRELVRVLAPGGRLLIYVYSRPDGRGVRHTGLAVAERLRRVTTRLPHRVLWLLSAPLSALLYGSFVLPGVLGDRFRLRALAALPLGAYRGAPMRSLWLDTFDRLSAPLEERYVWTDLEPWFVDAGLDVEAVRENAGLFVLARRPAGDLAR